MPLKDFFTCRFDSLVLDPEDPENGPTHENEIWISDPVQSYSTRNVKDIEVLGEKGVSLISPELASVLPI